MKKINVLNCRSVNSVSKYQKGVTMIEYALLAALISIAGIASMILIKPQLVSLWSTITSALGSAV
jgi:Flp pilus assembly pilin Flp